MGGQEAATQLSSTAYGVVPDTVQALLADAHALHQAGMRLDAVRLYRDALRLQPDHLTALHDLGILFHQLGLHEEALEYIDRALELSPDWATAHHNRGIVCRALKLDDAALASLYQAIACDPGHAGAHVALGGVLCKLKRYEQALAALDTAIELGAREAGLFNNHGVALSGLGKHDLALLSFAQALQIAPNDVETLDNRATVLQMLGRIPEALTDVDKAVSIDPASLAAQRHRANLLDLLGRFSEALTCAQGILDRFPESASDHIAAGVALTRLARYQEALAHFDRAIELEPDAPRAHANRGYVLLLLGDFTEGWKEHEWRSRTQSARDPRPDFLQPQWRGEADIEGKTILLHAEQGLGDTLQFCRFAPLVADRAEVILEVPGPLIRLMQSLQRGGRLVMAGDELPPFDLHCPLLSMPYALGMTLESLPGGVPYLAADAAQVEGWKARLAALPGLRIGLVWAGDPRRHDNDQHAMDRRRSLTLQQLAPLGAVPGVSFVSLQKGEAAGQAAHPPAGLVVHDWTAELGDFADTAALVEALDLVITVDTAVVHLAGALGKPVWVLNRFDTCWRWLPERDDSPWYPSLRLFRQQAPGDWAGVVHRVCAALRLLAG